MITIHFLFSRLLPRGPRREKGVWVTTWKVGRPPHGTC